MNEPTRGRSQRRADGRLGRPLVLLGALLLAACAAEPTSPGPDPTATAEGSAATRAPDAAATAATPDGTDGELVEALPVENVVATDTAVAPVVEPPSPVVCRLERRTGTNRKVKVCRRPATALAEEEMRQTFDSLRRSQMTVPE